MKFLCCSKLGCRVDCTALVLLCTKTLPTGIYLTSLDLNLISKREISVSLTGFCPDRETLLSFKGNLEKEEANNATENDETKY
mgnify:CR=1 FL=1